MPVWVAIAEDFRAFLRKRGIKNTYGDLMAFHIFFGSFFLVKQELQYIISSLPVNINRYERLAVDIDKQIALYKGVRQSDNRLLKKKAGKAKNAGEKQKGKPENRRGQEKET